MLEIQQYKEMKKMRDDWNTTDRLKYTRKQWEEFEDINYLVHNRFLFEDRIQDGKLGIKNCYSKEELEHIDTAEKIIDEMKKLREKDKLAFEYSPKYKYERLTLFGWENYYKHSNNSYFKTEMKKVKEAKEKEKLIMIAKIQRKLGCKLTIEDLLKLPKGIISSLAQEEKDFIAEKFHIGTRKEVIN
ncbi:hypothetical protein [Clostridium butyricum]|uniref:hypothetical protein n=1 Tax=Clostridium butyricum TaxID=1492 RepID=UPI00374F9436